MSDYTDEALATIHAAYPAIEKQVRAEGSVFMGGGVVCLLFGVRLSQETAMEGTNAPWEMAQKGVGDGKDERLGTLYLRRDNRHRSGSTARESWLCVEYAEIWQMAIRPNG